MLSHGGVFALALLVATAGVVSVVSAEGGNVRYSYEEARIADAQEYILVPRAEGNLSGDVNSRTLEQAFETLRQNKRSVYGNSYASVTGDDPSQAHVEVHIDSDSAQYAPVIKAEAVYTLTEYGVSEVHFPDFIDGGLTRADISIPAYTLTVPLWKVLPPATLTSAQVLMPDNQLVSLDEVERRWNDDREALLDDVYAFLDTEEPYTARQVVQALPDIGEIRIEEVTPLLVHDDRHVRRRALGVLEGFEDERPALEAISDAVDDESRTSLARQMAEFLGASSIDEFSVEESLYLFEEGDVSEAEAAVEELTRYDGDERVLDVLRRALADDRGDIPTYAVEALDEIDAHQVRYDALEDDELDDDIRMTIAEDLSDEDYPEEVRIVGLTYQANHLDGGFANQALREVSQLDFDEARQRVEEFLNDETRSRRRAAIDALVERGDVESVEALVATADVSSDGDEMLQAAYDLMVAQPLEEIIDQTGSDSDHVQRVAYRAIGERAARENGFDDAIDTIEAGTEHSDAEIRGASAQSLGQIGSDEALDILAGLVDDADPAVRENVALALGEFDGDDEHADILVDYLNDSSSDVVAAAISALEKRGEPLAVGRIREMVDADAPAVRAAALEATITFMPNQEDDTVAEHIGMLSESLTDDDAQVQIAALEQLGRFEKSMAVTNIAQLLSTDDADVRSSAIEALASTGHDDAQPLIESALSDRAADVRSQAVESLADLLGEAARPELEARMEQEDDPEVKELIETQLQQI